MSQLRLHLGVAVVAVVLASCSERPRENECGTMQATDYLLQAWPDGLVCGEESFVSVVSGSTQPERAKVAEGVGKVSSVLNGQYDLPTLTYLESAPDPLVRVTVVGEGSRYYGSSTRPDITLHRTDDLEGPQGARTVTIDDLDAVVLHELVEVIGFREKNNVGTPYPALVDCAVEVAPPPAPLNKTLCSHEVQSLYAAFHLRDGLDVDLERELVSAVQIQPARSELEIGEREAFVPVVDEEPVPRNGVSWLLSDPDNSLEVTSESHLQFEVEAIDEGSALLDTEIVATTAAVWPWPFADAAEIVVDSVLPPPADVDSVAVVPTEFDLDQNQPFVIMEATALDDQGASIPGVEFEWESSDRDVAEVDPVSGEQNKARVTGCWLDGTRTATITATASGTTESASAIATVTNVACR